MFTAEFNDKLKDLSSRYYSETDVDKHLELKDLIHEEEEKAKKWAKEQLAPPNKKKKNEFNLQAKLQNNEESQEIMMKIMLQDSKLRE